MPSPRPQTHQDLDPRLCGRILEVGPPRSLVSLKVIQEMVADSSGLVHGGFLFGLADHAAMIAVNEPTVVLASAETRFLAPVVLGECLEAEAWVEEVDGRRRRVQVVVRRQEKEVMTGLFQAYVPEKHVVPEPWS